MKKIVIVGAGTAGLAAAAMMKSYWKDQVDITLIYDKSRGNISVGESTTPIFRLLLGHLGVSTKELINDCLLYTSPSPRDRQKSRMPSSA